MWGGQRVSGGRRVGRSVASEGRGIDPSSSTFFLSIDPPPRTASPHKAHDTTTVFGVTRRILISLQHLQQRSGSGAQRCR